MEDLTNQSRSTKKTPFLQEIDLNIILPSMNRHSDRRFLSNFPILLRVYTARVTCSAHLVISDDIGVSLVMPGGQGSGGVTCREKPWWTGGGKAPTKKPKWWSPRG